MAKYVPIGPDSREFGHKIALVPKPDEVDAPRISSRRCTNARVLVPFSQTTQCVNLAGFAVADTERRNDPVPVLCAQPATRSSVIGDVSPSHRQNAPYESSPGC